MHGTLNFLKMPILCYGQGKPFCHPWAVNGSVVHEGFSGRQRINFLYSTGRQTLYGNKLHHWLMPHSGRENGKMRLVPIWSVFSSAVPGLAEWLPP